ncbi:Hypothetical protein D9617_1g080050 [Elsinoe fawcettii]|nr:Hypothetical protein D9617_1g080050 [Elsinoe fawcettii]
MPSKSFEQAFAAWEKSYTDMTKQKRADGDTERESVSGEARRAWEAGEMSKEEYKVMCLAETQSHLAWMKGVIYEARNHGRSAVEYAVLEAYEAMSEYDKGAAFAQGFAEGYTAGQEKGWENSVAETMGRTLAEGVADARRKEFAAWEEGFMACVAGPKQGMAKGLKIAMRASKQKAKAGEEEKSSMEQE